MTDLTSLTLAQARDALRKKEFPATELTEAHLAAIAEARGLNAFVLETPDRARDMAAAAAAWAKARELIAAPKLKFLVLDELNIALRYDYLPVAEIVATLRARRPDLHIVVTGRNAKPELLDAADLVTEMSLVKHHFAAGVKAQEGIEF